MNHVDFEFPLFNHSCFLFIYFSFFDFCKEKELKMYFNSRASRLL